MNEKVGIDNDEFEIYITSSIVHLFPDTKYIPGKIFIIKIDSRPGKKYGIACKAKKFGIPSIPRSSQHYQCLTRNGSELWAFQNHLPEELGNTNCQLD